MAPAPRNALDALRGALEVAIDAYIADHDSLCELDVSPFGGARLVRAEVRAALLAELADDELEAPAPANVWTEIDYAGGEPPRSPFDVSFRRLAEIGPGGGWPVYEVRGARASVEAFLAAGGFDLEAHELEPADEPAAACSCEVADVGDPENGPKLVVVEEDEACPVHGRAADPDGAWAEMDAFEAAERRSRELVPESVPGSFRVGGEPELGVEVGAPEDEVDPLPCSSPDTDGATLDGRHFSYCATCGWEGPLRDDSISAFEDAEAHRLAANARREQAAETPLERALRDGGDEARRIS